MRKHRPQSTTPAEFSAHTVAGLQLWLRADTLADTHQNGAPVSRWIDSSGCNRHAYAEVGHQPTFRARGPRDRPAVRFEGSTWLKIGDAVPAHAVFVVANHEDGRVFRTFRHVLSGGFAVLGMPGSSVYNPKSNWPRNLDPARFFVNGVATDSAAPLLWYRILTAYLTRAIAQPLAIGGSTFELGQNHVGCIAEVLAYDRDLEDDERQRIEGYLLARYSLPSPWVVGA
jgi:hypothetical protein